MAFPKGISNCETLLSFHRKFFIEFECLMLSRLYFKYLQLQYTYEISFKGDNSTGLSLADLVFGFFLSIFCWNRILNRNCNSK